MTNTSKGTATWTTLHTQRRGVHRHRVFSGISSVPTEACFWLSRFDPCYTRIYFTYKYRQFFFSFFFFFFITELWKESKAVTMESIENNTVTNWVADPVLVRKIALCACVCVCVKFGFVSEIVYVLVCVGMYVCVDRQLCDGLIGKPTKA